MDFSYVPGTGVRDGIYIAVTSVTCLINLVPSVYLLLYFLREKKIDKSRLN